MSITGFRLIAWIAGIGMLWLCAENPVYALDRSDPIPPIPLEIPDTDTRKAELGRKLFFDPQLSRSGDLSCASCHQFSAAGSDSHMLSPALDGGVTTRNSQSVFNLAYKTKYGWEGQFSSLASQARFVLDNEMQTEWAVSLRAFNADAEYRSLFRDAYNDEATAEHITDALQEYQLTLVTPNSRFDQYLRGDNQALTQKEIGGYRLFRDYGCISCHQGMLIGGNMLARIGVFESFYTKKEGSLAPDLGRYNTTQREHDRYRFLVPSLRNIAVTSPYLHNGSINTLFGMIKLMGKYQLGRDIPDGDARQIEAFLKTLTGELAEAIQ